MPRAKKNKDGVEALEEEKVEAAAEQPVDSEPEEEAKEECELEECELKEESPDEGPKPSLQEVDIPGVGLTKYHKVELMMLNGRQRTKYYTPDGLSYIV